MLMVTRDVPIITAQSVPQILGRVGHINTRSGHEGYFMRFSHSELWVIRAISVEPIRNQRLSCRRQIHALLRYHERLQQTNEQDF